LTGQSRNHLDLYPVPGDFHSDSNETAAVVGSSFLLWSFPLRLCFASDPRNGDEPRTLPSALSRSAARRKIVRFRLGVGWNVDAE